MEVHRQGVQAQRGVSISFYCKSPEPGLGRGVRCRNASEAKSDLTERAYQNMRPRMPARGAAG